MTALATVSAPSGVAPLPPFVIGKPRFALGLSFSPRGLSLGIGAHLDPVTYGEGFGRLASIVEDVWGDQEDRPLLIAPDSAFDGPWLADFLRRRPGPDVVTTHAYTLGAGVHWQAAQRSATLSMYGNL